MKGEAIWTSDNGRFRIMQYPDTDFSVDDLKGDVFDFEKSGYTGTREELAKEEKDFEELAEREGIFGYVLERWNAAPGMGWEHVDSCWGFVGAYTKGDKTFDHYIVQEMIETAEGEAIQ